MRAFRCPNFSIPHFIPSPLPLSRFRRPTIPISHRKTLIFGQIHCSRCPKLPFFAARSCSLGRIDVDVPPMENGRAVAASGEIHVIMGPMFAGKTTTLLRRMQSESNNGRNVAILKSSKDNRYALDSVVTHDGVKMPCWALAELSEFQATVGDETYDKVDVIGIDEAQFFEDLHDFCCNAADRDGKIVIIAGLDGDYLRRRFGSVLDVIPLADSVTKLTARCEFCGKRASFTLRKTGDTQTELIGGADAYMPVCRQHYISGQIIMESARLVVESKMIQSDSCLQETPLTIQTDSHPEATPLKI